MNINGSFVNYIELGSAKKSTIVLLHGWGQNIEMMKPLGDFFKRNHRVIIIDLPGHGKSHEPTFDYSIYDFAIVINELLKKLKVTNPILIGHSFGGKIALLYSSLFQVNKLVVLGSPYRKSQKQDSVKLKLLKGLKKIPFLQPFEEFAKNRMGSSDYRNASKIMRQTLVNSVSFDLSNDVKKITAPTLIIWGSRDEAVPLKEAEDLEKLISNAGLVVIENATHYAYLEHLSYVLKVINKLIEG